MPDGLGIYFNDQPSQDYEFDIGLANQILDEAGYLDTNDDGVREMPDGSQTAYLPPELAVRQHEPASRGRIAVGQHLGADRDQDGTGRHWIRIH
jgi:ABC-type transport system substrate-binding protein